MAKQKIQKNTSVDIYRPQLDTQKQESIKKFILINPNKTTKILIQKNFVNKNKTDCGKATSSLPIMRGCVKHISTNRARFKIVVRKVERPFNKDFEHQLTWICSSLGFFEPIDKEKNAAAVFKEIVLATEKGEALCSTAIAERVGMSRGAVLNHLNNLQRSGLIEKNGKYYSARSRSMKRTIEEIEEDVNRVFSQLKKTAEELDKQIGFDDEEK
jgi:predicted transcriptional regulator